MVEINVMFDGVCKEAVSFYANVFDKEVPHFVTYGEGDTSFDSNVQNSSSGNSLIMSTSLEIEGTRIHFNDMPNNFEFIRGNSFGLIITYSDINTAKLTFNLLKEDGQVFVPFSIVTKQEYYGMLVDKYNIMWTIKA